MVQWKETIDGYAEQKRKRGMYKCGSERVGGWKRERVSRDVRVGC
jgi:hypothetical protein